MNDPITEFQGEYRFLSNFWPIPIEYEGLLYSSTEAAFQAAKTLSPEQRKAISNMSPGQAKRAGRKVLLRADWELIKQGIMLELTRKKFVNTTLAGDLLLTENRQLIEGNKWNDTYWGVCRGKGHNHLGKILMRVRQEIQEKR